MSGDLFGSQAHQTNSSGSKDPWSNQAPYLNNSFGYAQQLYNQGPYQGPYIGNQSPYTQQAQQQLAQQNLGGQAQHTLSDTISGKYLDPSTNPFTAGYANDALGQVRAQFAKQYGGDAGQNLENSGYREQLARSMTQAALPIYSNIYSQERQNQLAASGAAPQFDLSNASNLLAAGQSQEQRSQQEVQAQQQQYQAPWANLQNYLQAINGNYGGQTQQQSPYYTNPLSSLIGLGIGGSSLYNMWSGGGAAGLLGGGGGGLLSGMGGAGAGAGSLIGDFAPVAAAALV